MKRYDGAVAVVTGASSGIGRRLALDLAGRGATVIGPARRGALLAELERALHDSSPASETHACDVSDTARFKDRLAAVEADHGRVDILINNAGIEQRTPVDEPEGQLDAYQRLFAT